MLTRSEETTTSHPTPSSATCGIWCKHQLTIICTSTVALVVLATIITLYIICRRVCTKRRNQNNRCPDKKLNDQFDENYNTEICQQEVDRLNGKKFSVTRVPEPCKVNARKISSHCQAELRVLICSELGDRLSFAKVDEQDRSVSPEFDSV